MQHSMKHTVIALFTDLGRAREAQQALLAAGFIGAGLDRVGTGTGRMAADAGARASVASASASASATASAPAATYHVLTVVTTSAAQIARAADIVARHGPVTIDEAARQRLLADDYFTERR